MKVFVLELEVNIRSGLFVRDIFREKNTKSKKIKGEIFAVCRRVNVKSNQ